MWHTDTMEYYAAIKDDEFVSFARTWMNLETIILSKMTQEQKFKHHMFSLIDGCSNQPGVSVPSSKATCGSITRDVPLQLAQAPCRVMEDLVVLMTSPVLGAGKSEIKVHFGRLKRADHLRSGVRCQPGQCDETLSLLKIQKLAEYGGTHFYLGGRGKRMASAQEVEAAASYDYTTELQPG
ncbi:retrotransposable element ORF2 protein [Plecturocebus cupreus]